MIVWEVKFYNVWYIVRLLNLSNSLIYLISFILASYYVNLVIIRMLKQL